MARTLPEVNFPGFIVDLKFLQETRDKLREAKPLAIVIIKGEMKKHCIHYATNCEVKVRRHTFSLRELFLRHDHILISFKVDEEVWPQ